MNCLRRSFPESRWCLARRRSPFAAVVLATLFSFAGPNSCIEAAPVTLQFDAIVGRPRIGFTSAVPPQWNVSLQQGDAVSGTFTFDALDAPSNTSISRVIQPYDFVFHIKSHSLSTSQYGIEVYNDNVGIDDRGINPSDDIYIGCSPTPSCAPALVSPSALYWSFQMILGSPPSVLDGPDIPSDPSTWQQLTAEGSLNVTFIDSIAHKSYGFLATPQTFRAIPEPSCTSLLIFCGMSLLFARGTYPRVCMRCMNGE